MDKVAHGAGFLRVLRFPLRIFIPPISPQSPSPLIRGWYNRPVVATVPKVPERKLKKKCYNSRDWDSSVVIATDKLLNGQSLIPGRGKMFFFIHNVQTWLWAMKLTTLLILVPRSRMVELYLDSPIRLHGIVFN
jgi:hypothetical protein